MRGGGKIKKETALGYMQGRSDELSKLKLERFLLLLFPQRGEREEEEEEEEEK